MPTTVTDASTSTGRTWPTTALLVVAATLLVLYQGFGAAITTAPFFGDTPSREDYIEAAMACMTALPALAAMIWCGWQRGSRAGLVVIAVLGAVMTLVGINLLATTGDSRDPDPDRAPALADLFGSLTWLNWGVTLVFVATAVFTLLLRRRVRHTEQGSAA